MRLNQSVLTSPTLTMGRGCFAFGGMRLADMPDIYALLTAREAAHYAGVTPQAIVNWRRRGHLEATTTPQGPRYRLLDVAKAEHATRKRARR